MPLQISARNQLSGKVTAVKLGNVMAQIEIQVGENQLVSVITRESAEGLDLKEGDEVVAIIKSTDVMVAKQEE
jgi:molybdopterin-binding protein